MRGHLSEPISLYQAADVACMEKTAFCKFFSKAVGITFLEFVHRWRVAVAVEQMVKCDASLSDVASAAGFQNFNSFARAFKKFTKLTPSDYRKTLLIKEEIVCQKMVNGRQEMSNVEDGIQRFGSRAIKGKAAAAGNRR
jgi:transcriptional regulator GlxA family with amidase domain